MGPLFPHSVAWAACTPNVPANSQAVSCTGADTTGISGGANAVNISFGAGATINTTGTPAVDLGTSIGLNANNNNTITSNATTIRAASGTITVAGGTISSSTGIAIMGIGAGGSLSITNLGTITGVGGTAVQFGNNVNTFVLGINGTTNGNVVAGSGVSDAFALGSSSGNGTFNAGELGTKYTGFEINRKIGASRWTLTGTGSQTWDVTGGILFGDTTSMAGNVAVANVANVTFNQAGNGTHSGTISGAGSLTKSGAGTVTMTGNKTYTGVTLIDGGVLSIAANNNIGTGALTLNTGGTLLTTASLTSTRGLVMTGAGTLDTAANTLTWSGVVSGAGALTKQGTGTLILSGANTHSGGMLINDGVLSIAAANNLGTGAVSLNTGGTVLATANLTATNGLGLTGAGTLDTGANTLTWGGVVSGAGALTKQGTGTLILSGTNTNSGGITVSGGTLQGNTDSIQGDITNNATLSFDQAAGGTFAGNISGTGAVNKDNAGTLTLTGTNSYTGNTLINGGAIQASADSNLGAAASALNINTGTFTYGAGFNTARGVVLGNANSIIDTNGFDSELSGVLSGAGTLNKNGLGQLTLSGLNTYSAGANVNAGRLAVNGTITGTTSIAAGGELGGTGTTGNIVNNGTLAPGNSIGTLNVVGDVTFNPGSVYAVEVDDAGNSDRTIATGNLIINGGTVNVEALAGSYGNTTNYTILQGATRAGNFDAVTSNLAFLDALLGYTADSVTLSLTRNDVSFNIVAADPVQQGVANAVEEMGAGSAIYDAFVGLSAQQASMALDTLSGEHNVGLTTAGIASAGSIKNSLINRMRTIFSSARSRAANDTHSASGALDPAAIEPAAGGDGFVKSQTSNVWSGVFGNSTRTNSAGTSPSQNRYSGGALFGADRKLGDRLYGGIFAGYERGEVYTDSQQANSDVDSYHFGAYGSWDTVTPLRFMGGLIGSYHQIDTTRHIDFNTFSETATGETQGFTTSAFLEGGYAIDFQTTRIEPYAGIGIAYSKISSYRETQGGDANLAVQSISEIKPFHTLGVRAGQSLFNWSDAALSASGRVGWEHGYGNLETKSRMRFLSGSTPFTVSGPTTSNDAITFGAGLELALPRATFVYTDYDGAYSADSTNHSISIGLKAQF